jgi:hypothetical protein
VPEFTAHTAAAETTVTHHFALTNTSGDSVIYDLAAFGGAWATSVNPSHVQLCCPGSGTDIQVLVTVPAAGGLPAQMPAIAGF